MYDHTKLVCIAILAFLARLAVGDDLSCIPFEGEGGTVCVCNETYCDTLERPIEMARGSYYFYSTSKATPGFTKSVGTFFNTTDNAALTTNMSADVYMTLDPSVTFQTYKGIGASFTDISALLMKNLSAGTLENLIESHFGKTGLEYTFIRMPIGASDFSPKIYTYDDHPGDEDLKFFNLTDYDLLYKIPLLKMANEASSRGVKIIGNTWTAPAWMKTNNDSSAPGYIRKEYFSQWATYHLKFLEAYKNAGIDIYAVSMGNEVTLGLLFGGFFNFPNTIMLPAEARFWAKNYLGPMLRSSEFSDIKILFLEDERPFMTWWSDRMFADPEVYNYMDGIALHWYFDSDTSVNRLENFNTKYPEKFILYTESSINSQQQSGGVVDLGSWDRAVRYIVNIFQNLQHWVVGYIDWNIVLNTDGGPGEETLDAAVIINTTTGEFYKQPIFYALGHFSKFIYPGSVRINVTIVQDDNSTNTESLESETDEVVDYNTETAGEMPKGRTPSGEPGSQTTTESPFPTRQPDTGSNTVVAIVTNNPDGSRTIVVYNPRSESANVVITDPEVGTLNQTLDANSVNSIVYWPNPSTL